jgi:hypothetical protein
MLNRAGPRQRSAPARTSSWRATAAAHARRSRPVRSRASPRDSVMTIARRPRHRVRGGRPRPLRPLHRRRDVPVRHRRRGLRGQLGRRSTDPVPRSDDHRDREEYHKAVRGQTDRYKDWVELVVTRIVAERSEPTGRRAAHATPGRPRGRRDLRHDAARRRPVRGHLAHGRGQAAHRRQLDWLGVHWIEGGLARANPKDEEFFRRAPNRAALSTSDARGVRLHPRPARQGRRRPHAAQPRRGRHARRPASSARAGDFHVTEALGTTLDEGDRHGGRVGGFLRSAGAAGALRRRALLRRLQGTTPSSACGCSRRRPPTARTTWCCATPTAAPCPTRCSASSARSSRTSRRRERSAIHTPRRLGLRGGQLPRRGASAAPCRCRAPSTGTASAPATQPHDRHPQPHAEDGRDDAARRAARSADGGVASRGRTGEPAATPGRPYVGSSAFAHKAGCTPRRSERSAASHTSTSTRRPSATARGCWCPTWAGAPGSP